MIKDLIIEGPDTDNDPTTREITIDAGGNSRIFNIDDGDNAVFSEVSISNLTITGGSVSASNNGGGIYSRESLSVSNSTLSGNSAAKNGGGIDIKEQSTLTVSNSTLSGNSAGQDGGGIYSSNSTLNLDSNTVTNNNSVRFGGAISSVRSSLTLDGSILNGNSSGQDGGGIISFQQSTISLSNSTLSGNSAAKNGGGIDIKEQSTLTVSNSTLSGNSAGQDGGGIYSSNSTLNLDSNTVTNNNSVRFGGAISSVRSSLTLDGSILNGNSSGQDGGGIISFQQSTISLSNSTLSGNSAAKNGGGINTVRSTLTLSNSTITNNRADQGGGVSYSSPASSSITVASTIIASNTAATGTDVFGAFTDSGNNLIQNTTDSTGFNESSTITGVNPLLGSLQDNGGATPTQALLPSSPAINAGSNPQNLTTDQRGTGFPRVNDGVADIGAFESSVNIPPFAANVGLVTLIDTAISVNLLARDFDPDGTIDPATYDLDPATAGRQTSLSVAAGSFTIDPQGILTFTPNSGFTGAVTPIQYTVADDLGATSNPATVTVNVSALANQPPETDNVFAPLPGIPGDAVQATLPVTLSGSDPDGTVVSFQITQLPTGGELFLNGTAVTTGQIIDITDAGNLTVTPNLGFSGGFITFAYEAIDNQGAHDLTPALYKAVVAPQDRPPETQNLSTTVQKANPPVSFAIPTLTGTDPDGTVDSFRITTLPGIGLELNGNLVDTVTPIPITEAGNLTFTPSAGFTGLATFNYVAIDNQGKEDPTPATVTITVTPAPNTDPDTDNHRSQIIDSALSAVTLIPNLTGSDADGTVDGFRIVTLPSSGTLEFNGTAVTASQEITATNEAATLTYTPDPNIAAGVNNLTFTYAAIDNQSGVDPTPATYILQVQGNNPPTANQVSIAAIDNTATNVALTPAPSGTDADGTIASFSVTTLPPASEGVLSVGGTAVTANQVLTPAEAATLTFTPNPNFTGIAQFSYTVTDDDGAVSTPGQYQIPVRRTTPPDLPPTVNSITLAPIVNDIATPVAITNLEGIDPEDGNPTSFTITSLPSNGQLLFNGNPATLNQVIPFAERGNLTYDPDNTFVGTDSFEYIATDSQNVNSTNSATVSIPVNQSNQPPIANTVTVAVINNTATNVTLTPAPSGTDADGTIASFTITQLPPANAGVLLLANNPVSVNQTLTPAEVATLTFTPDGAFTGNTSFSYTVTDDDGAVSANTGQVQIPVQSPTAPVDLPPTVNSITLAPIANDIATPVAITNLEGIDPEDGNPTSFTITSLPSNGQLLFNGNPATLNQVIPFAERGNLTYDPDNTFVGTDSFEYIATDSQNVDSINPAAVSIPVNQGNRPPIADTVTSNTLVSTDPNTALTPGLTATDPDNDPVTFTITQLPDPAAGELLLGGNPIGVGQTLDGTQATQLSFTPNPNFSGTAIVAYTATDNQGNISANTGQLQIPIQGGIVDLPPTVSSIDAGAITNDITTAAPIPNLEGTDPDGDPITFEITTLPSDGQLFFNGNAVTVGQSIAFADRGNLTYDPDNTFTGIDSFSYTATDGTLNAPNPATVSITVNPGNIPPSAADKTSAPIDNTTTDAAVPDLTGSDADGTVDGFRIIQLPSSGELLLNGTVFTDTTQILSTVEAASLTYNPDSTFNGNATFQYVAVDNGGLISAPATVTLTVTAANLPPIPVDLIAQTILNSAVDVAVPTLTATDPDGDAITEFTLSSLPSSGTLEFNGAAVAIGDTVALAEAANLTYTPDPNFIGDVSFTYTATDAQGLISNQVATVTLPIAIGNIPPIPNNATTTTVGTTPVAVPTLTATDPDGDTIASFTITNLPFSGTIALNANPVALGDVIAANDAGSLTYTANAGFVGTDFFDFSATDDRGAVSIVEGDISFNVTVPPNIPPIAETFSGPILANTGSPVPLPALRATDADGTVDSFTITQLPDPSIGTLFIGNTPVTNLAQVANLTPNDATNLSFATTVGFAGGTFLNLIYTATDDDGDTSNPATLTLPIEALPTPSQPPTTPTNQAPVAQNIDLDNITNNGTAVPIPALMASDNDGTVVSYAITTLPTAEQGQLLLNGTEVTDLTQVNSLSANQINQLSYIPNANFSGQFSLNYTATDNEGAISNNAAINFNVPNTSTGGGGGHAEIEALCQSPDVPNFTSFAVGISVISEVVESFESVITGTSEDDILVGNQLANAILGEGGNDIIDGQSNNDLIDGGGGEDIIFGNSGADTVIGDDIVASQGGADAIVGNSGDDVISLNVGADTLYGGVGNDFGYGGQDDDLMYGDIGNDTLFGDLGSDTLLGDRDIANSTVLEGQDILWGGAGDDFVDGNTNNDTVSGGAGEDTVRGGQQNDLVFGEAGNDLVYGDLGNDQVVGNEGNDTLYGGTGTTEIDTGNDTLNGGDGNDVMFGEDGRDIVCGDMGSDTLYGGGGSDTLIGGVGDDVLFGDEAADTLYGGDGRDGFVISSNSGGDVILDFADGVDTLRLSGLTFAELTLTQATTGTVIQQGNQVLATLEGVSLNLISEDDFTVV